MELIPRPNKRHSRRSLVCRVFGRWTVESYAGKDQHSNHRWNCQCTCGVRREVDGNHLQSSQSTSCGCLQRELVVSRQTKHGESRALLYGIWKSMKNRCSNPRNKVYSHYGGRGITVCARWSVSFQHFKDDLGEPPAGATIERKNNDGNYEPGNVVWAPMSVQANNKRNNIVIEDTHGNRKTRAQWCRELKIDRETLVKAMSLKVVT